MRRYQPLLRGALALVVVVAHAAAGALPPRAHRLAPIGDDGTIGAPFPGVGEPIEIGPSPGGASLLVDLPGKRLVEVDPRGAVTWHWKPVQDEPGASWAMGLPDGRVLGAAGPHGLLVIARDGHVDRHVPSPVRGADVRRAVPLADGSFLVSLTGAAEPLWRLTTSGEAHPFCVPVGESPPSPRRLSPGDAPGEAILWDPDWRFIYRVAAAGRVAEIRRRFDREDVDPSRGLLDVASDGEGGLVWVADGGRIGRLAADGTETSFHIPYACRSARRAPSGDGFLAAFLWIPDATWPDDRPAPSPVPTVSWPRLALWTCAGLAAAAGLVRRRNRRGPTLAAGAAAVALASGVLYLLRLSPATYSDAVGLFLAILIVLAGLAIPPERSAPRPGRLDVVLPLAVAAVTIGWRFDEIPANVHFDYFYNAFSAVNLLEGRVSDVFSYGFVPAPHAGLVPLAAGWLLAGTPAVGLRLVGLLAGLAGVFFAWLLAREVAGRRAALFTGLLLAGSIPWIHFGRLNCHVEAAAATVATLALFAWATRSADPGRFLLAGLAGGFSLYLWPGARAGLATCALVVVVAGLRRPREIPRRAAGPLLMLLAAAVWLVPLVPLWTSGTSTPLPRVTESIQVYKPGEGLHPGRLLASLGLPLLRAAGWFFTSEDEDADGHGSLSPGASPIEQALLVVGVALALRRRDGLLLPLANVALVLVVGGAFTETVWYYRLLPATPAASVLMGAAADALLGRTAAPGPRARRAATGVIALVLAALAGWNLVRYVRYEDGLESREGLTEMVSVGRALRTLPPEWPAYLAAAGDPEWSVNPSEMSHVCAELLPFVWSRRVSEIRDLPAALPSLRAPAAFVVPRHRPRDLARILGRFPGARVTTTRGFRTGEEPWVVLVDRS